MLSARRRAAPLGALALIVAAWLTGCGDDPELPSDPPAVFLERSLSENPVRSGEARVGIESESALGPGVPLAVTLAGPFAAGPGPVPRFDLDYEADAAGYGVEGELISTGVDAFVGFFGEYYRVGRDRLAEAGGRIRTADVAGGGPALGLDPASWFVEPRYEGVQEISGTSTARVAGGLDEGRFVGDVTRAAEAAGFEAVAGSLARGPIGNGSVEAWIGTEDATLRRLQVDAPGTLFFELELSEIGAEPEIEPPPGGGFKPVGDLIERLRGLGF